MRAGRIQSRLPATFVVPLGQLVDTDLLSVGHKALRLAELMRHGFQVPPGLCIRSEAYREFMRHNIPEALLQETQHHTSNGHLEAAQRSATEIAERMTPGPMPPALLEELRAAPSLLSAGFPEFTWAVRSSALEEDLEGRSFAGLYHTFLNVTSEASLLETIKLCWVSLWSDEAVAYRIKIRVAHAPAMAVIVQQMVVGQWSGVVFTTNPHSGCPTEICLNVVSGLNDALVSGDVTPNFYRLSKVTGSVLEQQIHSAASILPQKLLETLTENALRVEKLYGRHQDLEWTIRDQQIFLLQTRPMTQVPNYFPLPDSLPSGIDPKLAFVGLFSPFGASLEMEKNTVYCRATRKLTGVRSDDVQFLINGYIYDDHVIRYPWVGLAWLVARPLLLWKFLRPRRIERHFLEKLQKPYLQKVEALEAAVQQEREVGILIALLEKAIDNYFEFQRSSIVMVWLANNYSIQLRRFIRYFVPVPLSDAEVFGLLKGFESYTHCREREHSQLEATANNDDTLRCFLNRCTAREFSQRVQEQDLPAEFLTRFNDFARNFEYVWTSNNPKDAGWQVDYQLFLESFQRGTTSTQTAPSWSGIVNPHLEEIRASLSRTALDRALPFRHLLFDFLFTYARRFLPYRENRNHLFYRGVMAIRRVLLNLGKTLVDCDALSRAEEIFFLTLGEVRSLPQWLQDGDKKTLRTIIAARAEEYQANEFLSPPFSIRAERKAVTSGQPQCQQTFVVRGLACSGGVHCGTARIITSKSQFHTVKQSDILVCPKARPFFSSLFGTVGALITEKGGMLSHGAILAREYGIPAVLNIPSAMAVIQDGDRLTVDGDRGEVIIHSR